MEVLQGQPERIAQLTPSMIDSLRTLSRKSLYFFAKWVLGYSKLNKRIHKPICDILQDWTKRRVKIILPRGWYKSTLMNAFMIWAGCINPNIRILVVMNTHDNAVKKLSAIGDQFRSNKLIQVLFPEVVPDDSCTWTAEAKCLRRTQAWPESTFEAAGTRTKVVSRHYDVIIEDDTVSPDLDEITETNMLPTKEDIGQAIGWHKLANPLLNDQKTSRIIVVGTRWFDKDLLSYIDETDTEKVYSSYSRAALENENGDADENGEPTFPEEFDREVLRNLKVDMGPYMFACLYQNKPTQSEDMLFKLEWFLYYADLPNVRTLQFFTTVDPGGDPKETKGEPDFNVVLTCAKDMRSGHIYVVRYDRGKWNPGQLLDAIFKHIELFRPVKVGIEAVQYQKSLLYHVRERLKKESKRQAIEAITHNGRSKHARILGLQPLCSAGKISFLRQHKELIDEMLKFPLAKNDDIIDALAMQLAILPKTTGHVQEERVQDPAENYGISFEWAIENIRQGHRSPAQLHGPIGDLLLAPNPQSIASEASNRFATYFNKRRVS